MNRRNYFGSHLYGQIIVPLLIASVIVGLVAAIFATVFLRDITVQWITQVADAVTSNVTSSLDRQIDEMQRVAWLTARDASLQLDTEQGRTAAVVTYLDRTNQALHYDSIFVTDAAGTVLAATGDGKVKPGTAPLGAGGAAVPGAGRALRTIVASLGGEPALVSIQPFSGPDGAYFSVAVARRLTDEYLLSLSGRTGSAFCFYDTSGTRLACTAAAVRSQEESAALMQALMQGNPAVTSAMRLADSGKPGQASMKISGITYQLFARRLEVEGVPDGTGWMGYIVGAVSQEAADKAARTTTNLIMIWSIVAVVALVSLGGWIAGAVSRPLAEVALSARRVADGDFLTKVHVEGNNEITQLGEAFNDMTDSLRERSESLTKKVLELATLYEMSRALGSTLDMNELLGSVLDSALRIFDLDLGYVALRDKETGALDVRAARGVAPADPVDAVRSSMSEWVVREGRPLIFNPDPGGGDSQMDTVTGARAALCVPLTSSEGTIGSITVGSADVDYRFNSDDVRLLSTIANHVAIAIGNIELFSSLQDAYLATVRSLAAAVDAKDTYTRGHSDRVAMYSILIAERMGISHEQRVALEMAAYLHDIGKIGVAEAILLKPGTLTAAEMVEMRHHPLIGANILKPVAFPWAITPIVRHHHENFDGTGYPAGLRGEEIPLLARILTAADSFEAMTADRPYRKGLSPEAALEELRRCSGTQFDPRIVDVLVGIVEGEQGELQVEPAQATADIAPEEARAIFGALVDGVFASFRRLGGPRLASNVETSVDTTFEERGWPFRITRGRLSFTAPPAVGLGAELEQMRLATRCINEALCNVAGATLVDHFYSDAYDGFSARMRRQAAELHLDA